MATNRIQHNNRSPRYRSGYRRLGLAVAAALAAACVIAAPKIASACTVISGGLIYDKWTALEGDFGPCLTNQGTDGANGVVQQFDYGFIDYWTDQPQAWGVWGYIGAAWNSRYGGASGIGHPTADEVSFGQYSDIGALSIFYNTEFSSYAYLVWNPDTYYTENCFVHSDNVCEVYGAIGQAWYTADGGLYHAVGNPVDEASNWDSQHAGQSFNNGYITWNNTNGNICAYTRYSPYGPADYALYYMSGSSC
jgi:uncharacterized protein with LGFP repeats